MCPIDEALSWFDDLLDPGWRSVGVSAEQLKRLCQRHDRPLVILSGHRCVDRHEPVKRVKGVRAIALTCWQGHAYFYRDARIVASRRVAQMTASRIRFANETHTELPPVEEWQPWQGAPSPGYFFTEARRGLLQGGRSPKPILRNAATVDTVALRYECVKRLDGSHGTCTIRELPAEAEQIRAFLTRLPCQPPLEWRGEGLPGLTQRVLQHLLRAPRSYPSAALRAKIWTSNATCATSAAPPSLATWNGTT